MFLKRMFPFLLIWGGHGVCVPLYQHYLLVSTLQLVGLVYQLHIHRTLLLFAVPSCTVKSAFTETKRRYRILNGSEYLYVLVAHSCYIELECVAWKNLMFMFNTVNDCDDGCNGDMQHNSFMHGFQVHPLLMVVS